jgi:hypothetical protein
LFAELQKGVLDDRGTMATKLGEHTIQQPVHDGVLWPEVVQVWPGVVFRPRLPCGFDGFGHTIRLGAEHVAMVGVDHLSRQLAQAVLQVFRRGERDELFIIVWRPLGEFLLFAKHLERGFGELVVASKQAGRGVDLVEAAGWFGCGGYITAAK